jgi:hypothetical protein
MKVAVAEGYFVPSFLFDEHDAVCDSRVLPLAYVSHRRCICLFTGLDTLLRPVLPPRTCRQDVEQL